MSKLSIRTRKIRKTNHFKVSVGGSVEASNIQDFWEEVERVVKARPGAQITIDMKDLLFIASCGWAMLLIGSHQATSKNGSLILAGMAPSIRRIYKRMQLEKFLPAAK